jgi:hypothetical protein
MDSQASAGISLASVPSPQLSVLALAACFIAGGGALLALGQAAIESPSMAARCLPISALVAAIALARAAAHEIATCDGEVTGLRVVSCAVFLIGVLAGSAGAPLVS